MKMTQNQSIIRPVWCGNDDCMAGVARLYDDGSYQMIVKGCGHAPQIPTRETIKAAIAAKGNP